MSWYDAASIACLALSVVLKYRVQKVFGLPLFGKICFLLIFTIPMVGRRRLTVSKPVLKAPMVSALEAKI